MKVRTIKAKHVNSVLLNGRKNTRVILHKILLNVRNQYEQGELQHGICGEVKLRLPSIELIRKTIPALEMLFESWPEYSGSELYPVPSCSTELGAKEAFRKLHLWYTGEYAAARLRLLDYLIEQTK